jgi:hypothetical protein
MNRGLNFYLRSYHITINRGGDLRRRSGRLQTKRQNQHWYRQLTFWRNVRERDIVGVCYLSGVIHLQSAFEEGAEFPFYCDSFSDV